MRKQFHIWQIKAKHSVEKAKHTNKECSESTITGMAKKDKNPQIMIQQCMAGNERLLVKGRVYKNFTPYDPSEHQSRWGNFRRFLKRFFTRGHRHTVVAMNWGSMNRSITTDHLGYFNFTENLREEDWKNFPKEITFTTSEEVQTSHRLHTIAPHSRFGIISDIDDTVMVSHSTLWYKSLWLLLTHNATTRLPFEGVAKFYYDLVKAQPGPEEEGDNPVYYVSSSRWNLYDLISTFFRINHLPRGSFLLKKHTALFFTWKGLKNAFRPVRHVHKLNKIRLLFELSAEHQLPFVLIGDSGQHDAEIYKQIAEEYPDRVKAIYLRDVKEKRRETVRRLSKELEKEKGTEMVLVKNTREAEAHAQSIDLI